MNSPVEVVYQDGSSETFNSLMEIQCGLPALFRHPKRHRFTEYELSEEWPAVVYLTDRAGDFSNRYLRDIREIRAL